MSINEALKVLVDRGVDEETLKQVVLALGDVSQDVVKVPVYTVMIITGFDENPLIEMSQIFKSEQDARIYYRDLCDNVHRGIPLEVTNGTINIDTVSPLDVIAITISKDTVDEYLDYEVFCRKENLASCHAVVDYWMDNGHI